MSTYWDWYYFVILLLGACGKTLRQTDAGAGALGGSKGS